jgi:hypothetical protein
MPPSASGRGSDACLLHLPRRAAPIEIAWTTRQRRLGAGASAVMGKILLIPFIVNFSWTLLVVESAAPARARALFRPDRDPLHEMGGAMKFLEAWTVLVLMGSAAPALAQEPAFLRLDPNATRHVLAEGTVVTPSSSIPQPQPGAAVAFAHTNVQRRPATAPGLIGRRSRPMWSRSAAPAFRATLRAAPSSEKRHGMTAAAA